MKTLAGHIETLTGHIETLSSFRVLPEDTLHLLESFFVIPKVGPHLPAAVPCKPTLMSCMNE